MLEASGLSKKQGNRNWVNQYIKSIKIFIKCRALYFKSKKTDGTEVSSGVTRRNSHSAGMLYLLSAKLNLQNKVTIVTIKLSHHAEFAQRQAVSLYLFAVIGRSVEEWARTEQVAALPAWLPWRRTSCIRVQETLVHGLENAFCFFSHCILQRYHEVHSCFQQPVPPEPQSGRSYFSLQTQLYKPPSQTWSLLPQAHAFLWHRLRWPPVQRGEAQQWHLLCWQEEFLVSSGPHFSRELAGSTILHPGHLVLLSLLSLWQELYSYRNAQICWCWLGPPAGLLRWGRNRCWYLLNKGGCPKTSLSGASKPSGSRGSLGCGSGCSQGADTD